MQDCEAGAPVSLPWELARWEQGKIHQKEKVPGSETPKGRIWEKKPPGNWHYYTTAVWGL